MPDKEGAVILSSMQRKALVLSLFGVSAGAMAAAGLDVKVVQTRLRRASAKTTSDTCTHLWPNKDESARAAVADVLAARADSLRTSPASAQRSR